jgi:hypothetical protein
MVFPVVGGTQDTAAYEISNSIRVEADDSPKLSKTVSTATNNTNMTLSLWYKLGEAADMGFLSKFADSNNRFHLRIMSDGSLLAYNNVAGTYHYKTTTAKLRDYAAWYHIVFAYDTTDGTAADRLKIYLNGTRLTSFVNNTNPSSNEALKIASDTSNPIKLFCANDEDTYLSGYVADLYYIDGQTKAASDFGETNDNGVWIPKKYTGTFGNNGFKMEFQQTGTSANSSGIGADTGGNDHHLTVTNLTSIDITTDTPTNNFATMNPLDNYHSGFTFYEGNCKFLTAGSANAYNTATIGDLKQGKWYLEVKYTDPSHTGGGDAAGEFYGAISAIGHKLSDGISDTDTSTDLYATSYLHNFGYDINNGRIKNNNQAGTVHGAAGVEGNIIGFLLDLDNNRVTTHLNGQYADGSGNHDESSPTAYVSITAPASTPLGGYMIGFDETVGSSESGNQNTGTYEINFGNPSFSISSGNADANGYGNFEYAVPSGYFSLCTKNLAEYG